VLKNWGYVDGFFKNHCFLQCFMVLAAGIVLFLLVEKVVRYVEENSGEANSWTHGHHHHNHNSKKKLKDDNFSNDAKEDRLLDERKDDQVSSDVLKGDNPSQSETLLRKVRWAMECHFSTIGLVWSILMSHTLLLLFGDIDVLLFRCLTSWAGNAICKGNKIINMQNLNSCNSLFTLV